MSTSLPLQPGRAARRSALAPGGRARPHRAARSTPPPPGSGRRHRGLRATLSRGKKGLHGGMRGKGEEPASCGGVCAHGCAAAAGNGPGAPVCPGGGEGGSGVGSEEGSGGQRGPRPLWKPPPRWAGVRRSLLAGRVGFRQKTGKKRGAEPFGSRSPVGSQAGPG